MPDDINNKKIWLEEGYKTKKTPDKCISFLGVLNKYVFFIFDINTFK